MATLPQLIEEDIHVFEASLRDLLAHTEAGTALIIDQGGFLLASYGDKTSFDLTTLAALASGAYMANQTIANLVHEPQFNSVYQQGQKFSMFVICIDENCMLAVIFKAQVSVGVVKYFSAPAVEKTAAQFRVAQERDPSTRLDLSVLNLANPAEVFKRKN